MTGKIEFNKQPDQIHLEYPITRVEVIDNKYITNIHCNLWCKHDDIVEMLDNFKEQKIHKIHQINIKSDSTITNSKCSEVKPV